MEELTGEELDEFMAGYRAAQFNEPYWVHNTEPWKAGFAFWKQVQAEKDAKQWRH